MIRKYIIVDKISGQVIETMQWADNRDFPTDIQIDVTYDIIVADSGDVILPGDVYDPTLNTFYILDISVVDEEIYAIKYELSQLEIVLSESLEATWQALMLDETKLPQIWQDRLLQKRTLRARLQVLTSQP
jgi:hypothetical protein